MKNLALLLLNSCFLLSCSLHREANPVALANNTLHLQRLCTNCSSVVLPKGTVSNKSDEQTAELHLPQGYFFIGETAQGEILMGRSIKLSHNNILVEELQQNANQLPESIKTYNLNYFGYEAGQPVKVNALKVGIGDPIDALERIDQVLLHEELSQKTVNHIKDLHLASVHTYEQLVTLPAASSEDFQNSIVRQALNGMVQHLKNMAAHKQTPLTPEMCTVPVAVYGKLALITLPKAYVRADDFFGFAPLPAVHPANDLLLDLRQDGVFKVHAADHSLLSRL